MQRHELRFEDDDRPFQFGERYPTPIRSGFTDADTAAGAGSDSEDNLRRSPSAREDIPSAPLAERAGRGE